MNFHRAEPGFFCAHGRRRNFPHDFTDFFHSQFAGLFFYGWVLERGRRHVGHSRDCAAGFPARMIKLRCDPGPRRVDAYDGILQPVPLRIIPQTAIKRKCPRSFAYAKIFRN
ncbi:MAG: hypothetical protein DELT_03136 [Desulfovibrio sp.]